MKILAAFCAVFLPALLGAQVYEGVTLVQPATVADTTAVVPGKPFRVAVTLRMAPGWHTYWQYAGDAGVPTSIKWTLPEGFSAGPIQWPLPRAILEPGDIQVYAYKEEVTLLQTITPPATLSADAPVTLSARVAWLVCAEICIPGKADVSVSLPVAADAGGAAPANEAVFAAAAARLPAEGAPPVAVSWTRDGGDFVGRLTVPAGVTAVEFFPAPVGNEEIGHPKITREGPDAIIRISAAGDLRGVLALTDAQGQRGWWTEAAVAASPGDGRSPETGSQEAEAANDRRGEVSESSLPGGAERPGGTSAPLSFGALLAALGAGFLGGIILNLMPCVLPVISLKVFGFIRHAGASRRTIALHGVAFAAGIFAWFLALALVVVAVKAAGVEATWAFQFQNVWFNVVVATVVFAFALNLFGVFEITLPGRATSALTDAGAREGYGGSFSQGVFATLLATPCTGPFLGSALGIAFTQSAPVTLALFASVAAGMAMPYLALSLQPAWVRFLPKPGAWMERLKQFMGFPLLATLVWLLSVIGGQRGVGGIVWMAAFLVVVGFALWIYGAVASPVVSPAKRWTGIATALVAVGLAGWAFLGALARESAPGAKPPGSAADGIPWQPFTKAGLAALLAEGKPVFVDFTADWCISCKYNERIAIDVPAVRAKIAEMGVVPIKADWTNENPEITEALRAFGRVGVPFYVIYPAGRPNEPIILPEILTPQIVLDGLAKAAR